MYKKKDGNVFLIQFCSPIEYMRRHFLTTKLVQKVQIQEIGVLLKKVMKVVFVRDAARKNPGTH